MPLNGGEIERIVPIPALLAKGLASKPNEVALVSLLENVTWRELDQSATHLARQLLDLGLAPGDRVASLMPNRVALVIFYMACTRAALICVPLNYRLQASRVEQQPSLGGAALLFVHSERETEVAKLGESLRCGIPSYDSAEGREPSCEGLMARPAGELSLPSPRSRRACLPLLHLGQHRTGQGRRAGAQHGLHTGQQRRRNCADGGRCRLAGQLVCASGRLLFEPGGRHRRRPRGAGQVLSAGGNSRLAAPRTAERADDAADRAFRRDPQSRHHRGITLLAMFWPLWRRQGLLAPQEACRAKTGLTIHEGLGITEAGQITFNRAGGQIAVRNDVGELPAGQVGRMWVKSPAVMLGYWNDPAATAEVIEEGWLDTSDLVEADQDSFLWFRGRQKLLNVHDASNIAPQEVKEALLEHSAVNAAGVVGVADADALHGENVLAFVALKAGEAVPSAEKLIAFTRERIGYKAPEGIAFLDRLPLNPTRKLDRVALKALAEERNAL